ncbi:MAG: outer membrane beta-barrel protein [Bacteroidales bacterium]
MKSRIIFSVIAVMLLFATVTTSGQVSFGVKAGGILSTQVQNGVLWNNAGLRQSFHAGVYSELKCSNTVSVVAELKFQAKGTSYDYRSGGTSYKVIRRYDYVNIPVVLKAGTSEGLPESYRIYGYAGPYVGIQVYSKDAFRNAHPEDLTAITDSSSSPDLGLIVGAGISKKLMNNHEIFFEAAYEAGMIKIDNQDTEKRNKSVEASIGFTF